MRVVREEWPENGLGQNTQTIVDQIQITGTREIECGRNCRSGGGRITNLE